MEELFFRGHRQSSSRLYRGTYSSVKSEVTRSWVLRLIFFHVYPIAF